MVSLNNLVNMPNLKTAAVVFLTAMLMTQNIMAAVIITLVEYAANTWLFD